MYMFLGWKLSFFWRKSNVLYIKCTKWGNFFTHFHLWETINHWCTADAVHIVSSCEFMSGFVWILNMGFSLPKNFLYYGKIYLLIKTFHVLLHRCQKPSFLGEKNFDFNQKCIYTGFKTQNGEEFMGKYQKCY